MDMKRNEFIKYIKDNYVVDRDFDRLFEITEHSDVDGETLYSDDMIEIEKYFYSMLLETSDGETQALNFCIYCIYTKCYETADDYDFYSYENFDYIIV